jgi:hypothetical protein
MDDFVISNLYESRNEWCSRLVGTFTPLVVEGIRSLFNEAWKMCVDTDEVGKYLMTFQNLLSRVPTWNSVIVEQERKRIIERSGCNYLEDLITCVHIIQLKVLTCIRVGNKQKKIDISIPKLDHFIHKVYIHVARKIYTNVYLFEKSVTPLQIQKNNRELETIIQECILISVRESIPTEEIIRAYMDESVEDEEEVIIEAIKEPVLPEKAQDSADSEPKVEDKKEESVSVVPSIKNIDEEKVTTKLSFNDFDAVLNENNQVESVNAPKTIERLEEISTSRAMQRKLEEEADDDDKIKIHTDNLDISNLGIMDLDPVSSILSEEPPILDFDII